MAPFRIGTDMLTNTLYVGDYGPDAGAANAQRGPQGTVEWNIVTPGNYGWPYCVGNNQPYIDYNFATGASGSAFNCSAPANNSPHNTGQGTLPQSQSAWIPYDGGSVPEFGSGMESPMAGPVYRYDPEASPDGLAGSEGTFSLCTFMYVEALARSGQLQKARVTFEKMLTYANHVGLYAEEVGLTGEQLGNFPQAFTHLALINAVLHVIRAEEMPPTPGYGGRSASPWVSLDSRPTRPGRPG